MKVLFVAPYIGSVYGGTSKVVLELSQSLAAHGVDVNLVTTQANGLDKLDVPLKRWVNQDGYRVRYFSGWYRNDLVISPTLVNWLHRHVTEYDLVHTHTIFAPVLSAAHLICRQHQMPYIMTPHGMLEPWALSHKASKKKYYLKLLEKPALQRASYIQALALTEAKHIQSLGINSPIAVVPNGVHEHTFEVQADSNLFYDQFPETLGKVLVLFLGRIDPKKGLDLLAPALKKVRETFPRVHLVVAGPDSVSYLTTVKSFFEDANCLDAVTFTGMLTGDIKRAALAAADLYIAPYYSEGFSMSVLEGMASALPCVITTGCNFPEAAAAKAACEVDLDADEIASALTWCLANSYQAAAMGHRAKQFIFENYTWDRVAKKLIKVYEAIIDNKSLPNAPLIEVI